MAKKKKKINWKAVSWLVLLASSVLFYITSTGFIIFPKRFKVPLLIALGVLILVFALLSFLYKKGKTAVSVISFILSICLCTMSVFLPYLENKLRNIFTDTGNTEEFVVNVYALTSEYKAAHPEIFSSSMSSTEITDYSDKIFITQEAMDQENQAYALEQLKTMLSRDSVNTYSTMDILDAVSAFYNGQGDCLVLNELFEDSMEDLEGFESFSKDTQIVASITREVIVEPETEPEPEEKGLKPFVILVAGEDTRANKLKVYGRTDVDMVMAVNPDTRQILVTGFPRDTYLKNPALKNRMDKLTHLGNSGIQNTCKGLSAVLETDISEYFVVNFRTFKNIIDALGGIDINNPYAFRSTADTGGNMNSQNYSFKEGNIHLNGDMALSYVRERHNLKNGDYGRSEHQTIVLKAVINKLTSTEMITNFSSVLNSMQGQFITSYSTDNIYAIVQNQLDDNKPWNIVNYHVTGRGDSQPTASMGSRLLYVSWLYRQQVEFIKGEMKKVLNGETITQGKLPSDDKTIYRQE